MTALRFTGQALDEHPEKFSESSKGQALDGDAPAILLWLSERFCFSLKSVLETNARIVAGAFSALRGSFGHWT
jgi:hypothetical protein